MTIEKLGKARRKAAWLIAQRSGKTAAKALTIGGEGLEKTILEIADMYGLTEGERRVLRPLITDELQKGVSTIVTAAKSLVGAAATTADAGKMAKAVGAAKRLAGSARR